MISFNYWFSIVMCLFCAFFDNFIQATVFLGIAAVWHATEVILKEVRNVSKPQSDL